MSTLASTDAFTSYLSDERHFSPNTVRRYAADMRQYIEYLAKVNGIEIAQDEEYETFHRLTSVDRNAAESKNQIGRSIAPATVTQLMAGAGVETARRFLAYLGERRYSCATKARKIARLREYYEWAERRGLAHGNPMLLIRVPRLVKRAPKRTAVVQIVRLAKRLRPNRDVRIEVALVVVEAVLAVLGLVELARHL